MKWTAGKKRILLTSAVLISASAAFLFLLAGGGPERETRTFPVMGTVCGIDLYGNSGEILSRAADDAQREIRRLEAMFNIYDPDSELSRLNAAAFHHPFRCSEELWEILQQARKYPDGHRTNSKASSTVLTVFEAGIGSFKSCINSLNFSRSSA